MRDQPSFTIPSHGFGFGIPCRSSIAGPMHVRIGTLQLGSTEAAPALARIVAALPGLSPEVRAQLVALVDAAAEPPK
jgi:hypothetical protein